MTLADFICIALAPFGLWKVGELIEDFGNWIIKSKSDNTEPK